MKPSVIAATLLVSILNAGQFRFGLGRGESINAKLANLPAVRIGRATLAIDVKDATAIGNTAGGFPMTTGLPSAGPPADTTVPVTLIQAALDQVFRESFTIVQSNGDAMMRVAITHYTPAESRIDQTTQKARVPAPPNPDGTPRLDQFGNPEMLARDIVVENWSARGQISLRVEVVDSSGVLLDGFAPQSVVRATPAIVSVDGQDRVDRTQIPTHDQIRTKLIGDLVAQFVPRYAPAAEAVEIPLAVDDELRPGNKLAKEGEFEHAKQSWQGAVLKKQENRGDPIHNVGALYETQAYDLLLKQADPAKIGPYLERAGQQYKEAEAADPKEKYFTRAQERIRKAVQRVQRIADLEAVRQRTLAAKPLPSPWPPGSTQQPVLQPAADPVAPPPANPVVPAATEPVTAGPGVVQNLAPVAVAPSGQPAAQAAPVVESPAPAAVDPALAEALEQALNDPRADSAQETVFRQFVQLRMRAAGGAATDDSKRQLESVGPAAYSLTALQARRVVHQESKAWAAMLPKIEIYKESFAAFAQDTKITAEERSALRTMAKNLGLAEADTKAVESAVKFTE